MKKIKNLEIAKFIFKEMEKKEKEYEINWDLILKLVDDSIYYNNDLKKDENGDIVNEMSKEEIAKLENNMLDGIEEYLDNINENCNNF